jgi:translation elongation factor EF-1alpha
MKEKVKVIGVVTHYFGHIEVAIVKLKDVLKPGQKVKFLGHTTDFEQDVKEMQFDHKDIASGKKGQEVGIKVKGQVREGDKVLLA